MDATCLQISAHPSGLDVHDAASAQRDGIRRCPCRGDRLVEADRSGDDPGELGMPTNVLLVKRLLNEKQVERVKAPKQTGIGERVCRVGVDLEQDVAELFAYCSDRLDVPSRLDLELDALIALGEVPVDRIKQLRDAVHDAHAHAAGNAVMNRSQLPCE